MTFSITGHETVVEIPIAYSYLTPLFLFTLQEACHTTKHIVFRENVAPIQPKRH